MCMHSSLSYSLSLLLPSLPHIPSPTHSHTLTPPTLSPSLLTGLSSCATITSCLLATLGDEWSLHWEGQSTWEACGHHNHGTKSLSSHITLMMYNAVQNVLQDTSMSTINVTSSDHMWCRWQKKCVGGGTGGGYIMNALIAAVLLVTIRGFCQWVRAQKF